MERIYKEFGIEIKIKKIRRVRTGKEEEREMVIVKVTSEENKRNILEKRGRLKGKDIGIEEDQTFKEREMRWNLRRIAEEEERKLVRVGYNGI